jgi:hypothetical protein
VGDNFGIYQDRYISGANIMLLAQNMRSFRPVPGMYFAAIEKVACVIYCIAG